MIEQFAGFFNLKRDGQPKNDKYKHPLYPCSKSVMLRMTN